MTYCFIISVFLVTCTIIGSIDLFAFNATTIVPLYLFGPADGRESLCTIKNLIV